MTIAAIDTMVLVWGVRKQGTPEQLQRAAWLFQQLEEDEAQVVVPAIAVSEFLVPVPHEKHRATLAAISQRYIIAQFDARCAPLAADLFVKGKALRGIGKQPGDPGKRNCLKADAMIVASAYYAGARTLYSHDEDCRELARTIVGMNAYDLPDGPRHLFT